MQVVDDFSSKLDLPGFETLESIDADHKQMAKCTTRLDENYRAIAGVLKQFLKRGSRTADLPIRSLTQMRREEASNAKQEVVTR